VVSTFQKNSTPSSSRVVIIKKELSDESTVFPQKSQKHKLNDTASSPEDLNPQKQTQWKVNR
jgi:hypothetical protein